MFGALDTQTGFVGQNFDRCAKRRALLVTGLEGSELLFSSEDVIDNGYMF